LLVLQQGVGAGWESIVWPAEQLRPHGLSARDADAHGVGALLLAGERCSCCSRGSARVA